MIDYLLTFLIVLAVGFGALLMAWLVHRALPQKLKVPGLFALGFLMLTISSLGTGRLSPFLVLSIGAIAVVVYERKREVK